MKSLIIGLSTLVLFTGCAIGDWEFREKTREGINLSTQQVADQDFVLKEKCAKYLETEKNRMKIERPKGTYENQLISLNYSKLLNTCVAKWWFGGSEIDKDYDVPTRYEYIDVLSNESIYGIPTIDEQVYQSTSKDNISSSILDARAKEYEDHIQLMR